MENSDLVTQLIERRRALGISETKLPPKLELSVPAFSPERHAKRLEAIAERERKKEHFDRAYRFREFIRKRGKRYAECTIESYRVECEDQARALSQVKKYLADLPERIRFGDSVVFFGPPGTGKDHLMVAMIREAILRHGAKADWINGMDFYGLVRDRMEGTSSEQSLIETLCRPDILAISDPLPPFGTLTPFQSQMMFRLIDARYSQQRPTWVTMNATKGEEAAEKIGAASIDRLRHNALRILCDWKSFRAEPKNGPSGTPQVKSS